MEASKQRRPQPVRKKYHLSDVVASGLGADQEILLWLDEGANVKEKTNYFSEFAGGS